MHWRSLTHHSSVTNAAPQRAAGAAPTGMESQVTRIIEDSVSGLGQVRHITSTVNDAEVHDAARSAAGGLVEGWVTLVGHDLASDALLAPTFMPIVLLRFSRAAAVR